MNEHLKENAFARARNDLERVVHYHQNTLLRKRKILLKEDDYGIQDRSLWDREIAYFIANVLSSTAHFTCADENEPPQTYARTCEQWILVVTTDELEWMIESQLNDLESEAESVDQMPTNVTPRDYEAYCSQILESNGWSTRLTAVTGDQGVDIVAEFGNVVVAIQCKLYSSKIGNSAVQEVVAGRAFVGAHYGVVVSNQEFTDGAKKLARVNDVMLLHHDELTTLAEVLNL